MTSRYDRRDILKGVGAVCAASFLRASKIEAAQHTLQIAGRNVEVQIAPVSANTLRLSVLPVENGQPQSIKGNGSLVQASWGPPFAKLIGEERERTFKSGELSIKLTANPLQVVVQNAEGTIAQRLTIDSETGAVSFLIGDSALLGLGEGGPQFDRRGSTDLMRSGQGGYELGTHGGRVPIPWLIGTAGWAMYIHHPFGTFDFTGPQSKFIPSNPDGVLPFDVFLVVSRDPGIIMSEYARLTGYAELPPRWSLG